MVRAGQRNRVAAGLCVALLLLAGAAPARAASPDEDAAFLNALTWGVTPSGFAELRALGRARWLAAQLHPRAEPRLPPAAQAQVEALTPRQPLRERIVALDAQQRAAGALPDAEARKAALQAYQEALNAALRDAVAATLLRALSSPDQLRERLTWIWFNRFNVHQGKANLRAMVGDYLDTAIRPHALGRFRDLLGATLRHPAMLRYLDNAENAAGRLNENYARELMELHTMGVGSGYTQADVEALARILTGIGLDARPEDPKLPPERRADLIRDGVFIFNPARHDYGDKVLLGHTIRGRGFAEVEEALDLLAAQPATARHVSRMLAAALTGAEPPDALVERLAAVFVRTRGDIAATVAALAESPDLTRAAAPFKDPMRYVLSALRLAYDTRVILNTGPVQGWLTRLGEGLFNRSTPDGYPLAAAAWNGPGQLVARFEVARQIGSGPAGLFRPPGPDATEEPAFPLVQNALYFSTLAGMLGEPTRAALARAVSPQEWNTLFLSSPEFMR
ncbi:Protein of unknown function DUF1800 [Methylobacterium sp. 4-46]|uniref:DUF1800 domain-containing protein n=1 Tax=unclassified Methylobacterium TaxID=2615210 RepID=UPI000152BFF9|nr:MULTISPECIES: DUF1800 domain-containing protein [Methylobacterium]ACA19504.1 Protein of unknown function DUF1800 [Methylobacterium sp. 4-46]WFT78700.1 DUF1800 domain-containing protein [Methylobacterium nodulans]